MNVPAIVLVEPRDPGNLGAVARAMANFGLTRLIVTGDAALSERDLFTARRGGRPLLDSLERAPDLAAALQPFQVAIAVTRRLGKHRPSDLGPGGLAEFLAGQPDDTEVALVFGREASGLHSDEVQLCGRLLSIPTNPGAPSLNLAQAVTIVAFHLYQAGITTARRGVRTVGRDRLATSIEVEEFLAALEPALASIGFFEGTRRADTMLTIRRIFGRAHLSDRDVRLLRGLAHRLESPVRRRAEDES